MHTDLKQPAELATPLKAILQAAQQGTVAGKIQESYSSPRANGSAFAFFLRRKFFPTNTTINVIRDLKTALKQVLLIRQVDADGPRILRYKLAEAA